MSVSAARVFEIEGVEGRDATGCDDQWDVAGTIAWRLHEAVGSCQIRALAEIRRRSDSPRLKTQM